LFVKEVGNLHWYSFPLLDRSRLDPDEVGFPDTLDQLLFHLISSRKVELLRGFFIFVNDAAISSGELDRAADDGAEHRVKIKSRAGLGLPLLVL
jgi:hypothetical protein